jgi:hypothetical protein
VAQSLRRQGLRAKGARKYKATTNSNHNLPVALNLLQQDFSAERANQKWVSDITYIATEEGWLYLAVVVDLYSRIVVGWSMSERMTATLVCDALKMAIFRRHRPSDVIVHSDRGSQYCSREYQQLLNEHDLICSMSKKGPDWMNPLDATYAQQFGGRWNGSESFPALYLNADVRTARSQIDRLLADTPVTADDLADDSYTLVAAKIPRAQSAADAVTAPGLRSMQLHEDYPLDARGKRVPHSVCQAIGDKVRATLQGIWCRSACTDDGRGRELAWFPADQQSASAVWPQALPLGQWRYADSWKDLALQDQPDPA